VIEFLLSLAAYIVGGVASAPVFVRHCYLMNRRWDEQALAKNRVDLAEYHKAIEKGGDHERYNYVRERTPQTTLKLRQDATVSGIWLSLTWPFYWFVMMAKRVAFAPEERAAKLDAELKRQELTRDQAAKILADHREERRLEVLTAMGALDEELEAPERRASLIERLRPKRSTR
jgi:hypothetical protein